MAHTVTPYHNQGYSHSQQQQSGINNSFVVVDQQPSQREVFPYRLEVNWLLGFSIAKCIFGVALFSTGVVYNSEATYETKIAAPIWSGVIIIASGIFGSILKCKQTKCLIGIFLGLSITTLILDLAMLPFYSVVLDYFVNFQVYWYPGVYYQYSDYRAIKDKIKGVGTALSSILVALIVSELVCSIQSIVLSCRAYSKCCNTCNMNDCSTCLGCCECDSLPSNTTQGVQPAVQAYAGHQNMQMTSLEPPPYQSNQQRAQSNPCSDVVSFIINIPSYVFGTANGTQLSAINVNLQPVTSNQQTSLSEHDSVTVQMPETTSSTICNNQTDSTHIT